MQPGLNIHTHLRIVFALCAFGIVGNASLVAASNLPEQQMQITAYAPPSEQVETSQLAEKNEPSDTSKPKITMINISGNISKNSYSTILRQLPKTNQDPIPAGLIVLLDSPGGDGIAAMQIGRLLRAEKAHVFVTGQCASACILVLASGVVRSAPAYSVGIHRGRITLSDKNAKIIQEIDTNTNPQAKALLEKFEKEVPIYFAEMGMPPDLFMAMQAHQYKGVYRLSKEELVFYGLNGFDPNYLEERSKMFQNMQGAYHLDKDELHRRTLKVATICAEFDQSSTAFIGCYKKVLQDPYLN
jgi:hypothetical protein